MFGNYGYPYGRSVIVEEVIEDLFDDDFYDDDDYPDDIW